jgi:four helix bundle protein
MQPNDRLESFRIYQLARQLFDDFWADSEILGRDYRGRELVKQQVRSLDSICANMEEGYGRGFGKELPQHLRISRGEARESRGRYERCQRLLPSGTIAKRVGTLDQIIGGLIKTLVTLHTKQGAKTGPTACDNDVWDSLSPEPSSPSSPVTRHPSHLSP